MIRHLLPLLLFTTVLLYQNCADVSLLPRVTCPQGENCSESVDPTPTPSPTPTPTPTPAPVAARVAISNSWFRVENLTVGMFGLFDSTTGASVQSGQGTQSEDYYGNGLIAISDYNDDGYTDFIFSESNNYGVATMHVRSGADGSNIHTFTALNTAQHGRTFAELGDLDGDGKPEILVEYRYSPQFVLLNSQSLTVEYISIPGLTWPDANEYHQLGDYNNDGINEILLTNRNNDNTYTFRMVDFKNREVMATATAPANTYYDFYKALISTHDVDGDGVEDILLIYRNSYTFTHFKLHAISGKEFIENNQLVDVMTYDPGRSPVHQSYTGATALFGNFLSNPGKEIAFLYSPTPTTTSLVILNLQGQVLRTTDISSLYATKRNLSVVLTSSDLNSDGYDDLVISNRTDDTVVYNVFGQSILYRLALPTAADTAAIIKTPANN